MGDHIAVKEAVLPFGRFPDSDALLGPEMQLDRRGDGHRPHRRPGVRQVAARRRRPHADRGHDLHVARRSRQAHRRRAAARTFRELGFSIVGHARARPKHLMDEGIDVEAVVSQGVRRGAVGWPGRRRPDRRPAASSWSSTRPRGRGPRADGIYIRAAAGASPRAAAHDRVGRARRGQRDRRVGAPRARGPAAAGVPRGVAGSRPMSRWSASRRSPPVAPRRRPVDRAGRLGRAGQPGHVRVGHRRPRRRAGSLPRPVGARGGRGEVAVGRAVARQPAAAGPRDDRRG